MRRGSRKLSAILTALWWITLDAAAQGNPKGAKEYSEGAYQRIPFYFPDVLSDSDMREIVALVEEATTGEIAFVTYSISRDRVSVGTCEKGSISAQTCNSGRGFVFRQYKPEWQLMDYPQAGWEE
jgi:hypothetical protein